jgi:fatty acid desaturase
LLLFLTLAALSIDPERKSWLPYLFGACCSLLLIGMVGIGHNFIHHRDNIFKYFHCATGFTHNEWQIMHCISHHIYPNLELDYEAAALEPLGYFLRNSPENKWYTEPIIVFSFVFLQPLNFLLKIIVVPIIKRKKPELWYLLPMSVLLLFYCVSGDIWYSLKLHMFIYGLFGLVYNRVLFCGHRLQELWSEGAERIQDFGEHTISVTNDTDTWITGFYSYLFLAGFNIHTPHHFFPTADHAALPKIMTIINRVCKKMGVKHYETSRGKCFVSLSKGIVSRIPFVRK